MWRASTGCLDWLKAVGALADKLPDASQLFTGCVQLARAQGLPEDQLKPLIDEFLRTAKANGASNADLAQISKAVAAP